MKMINFENRKLFTIFVICAALMPSVADAHGRMLDPPSRMSAYLLGFPTPVNYNDHQMFCGGRAVQWQQNGGKCGVCGDPWSGPRDYERPNGALLPRSVVPTKIYQENDVINIVIQITANHMGWHEFRVCDIESSGGVEATQECLDRNVLSDSSGTSRFYLEGLYIGFKNYTFVLPAGFTCSRCLLQWKWHCGNDWGCDERGCGVGYGAVQEEFYACSDVVIAPRNGSLASLTTTTSLSTQPEEPRTTHVAETTITATTNTPATASAPFLHNVTMTTSGTATSTAAPDVTISTSNIDITRPTLPNISSTKANPSSYKPYFQIIIDTINPGSNSETKLPYYKNPEYIKMLQGFPNTYNPANATQNTPFNIILNMLKPQTLTSTTPNPQTPNLVNDRICAVCFFGCHLALCPTHCPVLCPTVA